MSESKGLSVSLAAWKTEIRSIQQHLKKAVDVDQLKVAVGDLEKQLGELRAQNAQLIDLKRTEITSLHQSLDQVNALTLEIQNGAGMGATANLGQIDQEIAKQQASINQFETTISKLGGEIDQLFKRKSEIGLIRRRVDDNIKCRAIRRQMEELEVRAAQLVSQMGEFDTSTLEKTYTKIKQTHEKLMTERAQGLGELKQIQDQVERLCLELNTVYKDTDSIYSQHTIKATVQFIYTD